MEMLARRHIGTEVSTTPEAMLALRGASCSDRDEGEAVEEIVGWVLCNGVVAI